MSAALDGIRAKVGARNCDRSCSRDGCCVDLTDVPTDRIIVDVDKAFPAHEQGGRRCDFILFVDRSDGSILAAPVELKSGRTDVSEAVRQLRGGADFADRFAPQSSNVDCLPVLIHGRVLDRKERNRLNRGKIVFRGREHTISTARCGRSRNLANVLPG